MNLNNISQWDKNKGFVRITCTILFASLLFVDLPTFLSFTPSWMPLIYNSITSTLSFLKSRLIKRIVSANINPIIQILIIKLIIKLIIIVFIKPIIKLIIIIIIAFILSYVQSGCLEISRGQVFGKTLKFSSTHSLQSYASLLSLHIFSPSCTELSRIIFILYWEWQVLFSRAIACMSNSIIIFSSVLLEAFCCGSSILYRRLIPGKR